VPLQVRLRGLVMTSSDGWTVSAVRTELEKIESLIAAAARLINDGRMIDLGALVQRTQKTCDAAVSLAPRDSKSLLPDLEQVIEHLDGLSDKLNERFGSLPNLQNEAAPDVAASAYCRANEVKR